LDRSVEIRSIERLKFRDKNKDNELRVSSSIKMEFVSSLLPEFISIWNVRSRVRPYINRVRKCFNCLRWGHSSVFCRGRSNCSRCGDVHDSENCQGDSFHCPDCGQIHSPFNFNCPVFLKYQLINQVMAFCNTSQYNAKRLIKSKNIVDGNQVEKLFKSSAYLAWNSLDILSNFGNTESSSTPSIVNSKVKNLRRHKVKHGKSFDPLISGSECDSASSHMDDTLMPSTNVEGVRPLNKLLDIENSRDNVNTNQSQNIDHENNGSSLENLFPSPGVIIKDIYDIFIANGPTKERDSAILNYIKLVFQK